MATPLIMFMSEILKNVSSSKAYIILLPSQLRYGDDDGDDDEDVTL